MNDWHTDKQIDDNGAYCGTTHCRAGWVVTLSGSEGRLLEQFTDTCFAAMMIYKASSPIKVSPVRFFEMDNDLALADIKRCAEEEANLTK